MENIEQRVKDRLPNNGVPEIPKSDRILFRRRSRARDSLDTVELVMALEEEFDCEIPDEEAEKITSVQQGVDFTPWT